MSTSCSEDDCSKEEKEPDLPAAADRSTDVERSIDAERLPDNGRERWLLSC